MKTHDLKNYFHGGGIILFVVEIEKETFNVKPYVKILLPLDLKQILSGKEKQKKISVYLDHLESHLELEKLCGLFHSNRPKQGQVLLNTTAQDLANVREFSFSTTPGHFNDPAIAIVKNPNKYMYARQSGLYIPIESYHITTSREGSIRIKSGDNYDQVHHTKTVFEADATTITIDTLLQIKLNEKNDSTTYRVNNGWDANFETTFKFSKLAMALVQAAEIRFDNRIVADNNQNLFCELFNPDLQRYFKEAMQLGDIFLELGIPLSTFVTKEVFENRTRIKDLRRALVDNEPVTLPVDKDSGLYYQSLASKKMVLEYEKLENGKFLLRDFLSDSKNIAVVLEEDGAHFRVNNWFAVTPANLNSIIFDHEKMIEGLKCELSDVELNNLVNLVLAAISEYDRNKKVEWLDLASELNKIIEGAEAEKGEVITINQAQISFRRGGLSDDQKRALLKIKVSSQNLSAQCCACILLRQLEEFDLLFTNLSIEEQKGFKTWPIYNLFS